jgi:hypothetical protein
MKIRIKKIVLGEEYLFYAQIKVKYHDCKAWMCATEKEYPAKVRQTSLR